MKRFLMNFGIALCFTSLGISIIATGRHLLLRPELTQSQAVREFWGLHLAAVLCGIMGFSIVIYGDKR